MSKTILLMLNIYVQWYLCKCLLLYILTFHAWRKGTVCTPFTIWHRQKRTFQFHSIYHWTWSKQSNLQGKLSSLRYPDLIYSNRAFLPDTINCLWIFSSLYPPQKGNKKEACTASSLRRFIDIDAVGILPISPGDQSSPSRGVLRGVSSLCGVVPWCKGECVCGWQPHRNRVLPQINRLSHARWWNDHRNHPCDQTQAAVSGGEENLNWPESNKQSTATKSDAAASISVH